MPAHIEAEVSGGVTLETIRGIALTGPRHPDFISVGLPDAFRRGCRLQHDPGQRLIIPNPKETMSRFSDAITAIKQGLGDRLCIMGHHYQHDDVVRHCDVTGDSLELARRIEGIDARAHRVLRRVLHGRIRGPAGQTGPERAYARLGRPTA